MTIFQERPSEETTASRMRGRIREVSLPMLSPPDPSGYVEHATPDGRRVFVAPSVLEALVLLEREHHPNETGGLVFGRYFTDGRNRCTIVTDLIPPEPGEVEGTRTSVTITAGGARQMRARARHRIPCADPVGWGHTHPTFPPFFSGTDRTEQRLWTESTSVGIVLSGIREAGELYHVYVGPESTLAKAISSPRPHTIPVVPVETPRAEQRPQVAYPSRPRRVPAYRVGLAAAAAAALAVAILGWRDATMARQVAERAEARSAAVSQLAAVTGAQTRSGKVTAERAIREAHGASLKAARTGRLVHTQLGVMRTRTEGAQKAATSATALGERAIQQSEAAVATVISMKAEVDALRAAAAQHAQHGNAQKSRTSGKTKPSHQPTPSTSTPSGRGR